MPVKKVVGCGGRERKGNGAGCSPEGEHILAGAFVLRLFSLLQVGILGEVSGEGLVAYSSVPQMPPFRVMVSSDWSEAVQGVFSYCSSGEAHLLLLLFWAWSRNTTEALMLSPGRKGQGRGGYPGREALVIPVLPPARPLGTSPG